MSLTVKLEDLVRSENALASLARHNVSARMSFTIALVVKEVGKHLAAKQEAHRNLLERYGTPIEEQVGSFQIPVENRSAFEKEFRELMETEVELVGIGKIRASSLEAENIALSGMERFQLGWLINEDGSPLFDEH
jgi:hypothetical protein